MGSDVAEATFLAVYRVLLAPFTPLSCTLRASARHDAVSALPSRLGFRKMNPTLAHVAMDIDGTTRGQFFELFYAFPGALLSNWRVFS
jgi:hypothetical protein